MPEWPTFLRSDSQWCCVWETLTPDSLSRVIAAWNGFHLADDLRGDASCDVIRDDISVVRLGELDSPNTRSQGVLQLRGLERG